MFDLSGKVALVTGGSRGIGRATAQALAAQGARVVVGYGSNEAAARRHRPGDRTVRRQRGNPRLRRGRHGRDGEAPLPRLSSERGRLDILVANAGVSIDALLLRLTEEDLDRTLAVNLKGAIACAKAALKPMIRAKAGRILFVSSVVGESGNAGQPLMRLPKPPCSE